MSSQVEPVTITGVGGLRLEGWVWTPTSTPRALVWLVHGYAEHLGRYAHVIDHLLRHGLAVAGLDHRGHGRSEGPRATVSRFDEYVDDYRTFVLAVRARMPGCRELMIAHSLGGLIAVRYALRHQRELSGLVTSSAALVVSGTTPFQERVVAGIAKLAPEFPVRHVDPSLLSRDPAVIKQFQEDPLCYQKGVQALFAHQLLSAGRATLQEVGRIDLPLLAMHGAADRFTDPQGTRQLHDGAQSQDKTCKLWPGLRHEIFNEPEKHEVLTFVTDWLNGRIG